MKNVDPQASPSGGEDPAKDPLLMPAQARFLSRKIICHYPLRFAPAAGLPAPEPSEAKGPESPAEPLARSTP